MRNDEWLAHRLLGALLSREGNYKAASPLLQRAIGIRPTYISTYDHLYHVLYRLDRYQEAIEIADRGIAMARKQIQRVPDDQDARVHMATLLARMGLRDDALEQLARAHELGPKDGFTAFHVATVHAILGNPIEALSALEQAQSRLDVVARQRAETLPDGKNEPFPALVSAKEAAIDFGGPSASRKLSWLLFAMVGLLLVLACADAAPANAAVRPINTTNRLTDEIMKWALSRVGG